MRLSIVRGWKAILNGSVVAIAGGFMCLFPGGSFYMGIGFAIMGTAVVVRGIRTR
jgi:hypothetical protein